MPRVIGIDPGTVNIDLCGLEDGRVFLDRTFPTAEALQQPAQLIDLLRAAAPLDLIAGPSGYGLPLIAARDLTETDLRLAYLAAEREPGGIGGLRALMRLLGHSGLPVVLTPGVIHLASVPAHRKVNRVDMGTADKVCAAVLALREYVVRRDCRAEEASFILLELGGAFTAGVAVRNGRIVDGVGGTSGPLGLRAAGALDGEVAFLAGTVSKQMLFSGGADAIAETRGAAAETIARPVTAPGRLAWSAYVETAVKAVAALAVSVPDAAEVMLSGRLALVSGVREEFARHLTTVLSGVRVVVLSGFAAVAKQAAQGAALMADGLAGGPSEPLVVALGIREASGTALDHLYVVSPDVARRRIGIDTPQR
jgi:predicted butyrate kinase (DUF1464 family)